MRSTARTALAAWRASGLDHSLYEGPVLRVYLGTFLPANLLEVLVPLLLDCSRCACSACCALCCPQVGAQSV